MPDRSMRPLRMQACTRMMKIAVKQVVFTLQRSTPSERLLMRTESSALRDRGAAESGKLLGLHAHQMAHCTLSAALLGSAA